MTTYPLPTLAPSIDASGISVPSYLDILLSLQASFQSIYGNDIYITPDSQDGQWIAIIAKALYDTNMVAVSVFQSFSPTYAQGADLSNLVKINGLKRNVSGFSTAVGNVVGVAGTIINNGVVRDANKNLWNLPVTVTIPITGSIAVTVTAQTPGAIVAASGSINAIYNPQLGWQSFVSTSDASIGAAVESDPALKARQAISTALPAQTVMDGILASVGNVYGVTRFTGYDNDTGITDANGVPAHSLVVIVEGGAVSDIGTAIALKKMPGAQTFGTTTYTYIDNYGIPTNINYFVLSKTYIYITITIHPLLNYVSTTGDKIQAALMNYINGLDIGYGVYQDQLIAISSLLDPSVYDGIGKSFKVSSLLLGTAPTPTLTSDIVVAYNSAANTDLTKIQLIVI